ncbi:hypothetical protein [Candidatus Thiosymbion oneisti]|uniref:hypothetical protein n=1 Tax=Candidatus Thiosymbion oneisti TaxID=589554 RepID=UPI000B7E930D|nr:hypothetical protein [Candidatus Thiosymbion oneisti]
MTDYVFTAASLTGTYAVAMEGEGGYAPYAAFGLISFDGTGTVSGYFTESRVGSTFGERELVRQPYRGRYRVNANGLGTLHPEDSDEVDCYLAVREVTDHPSGPGVREIALIFRTLDPASGSLRTGVGWLRPAEARYGNASLDGRYTGFAVGRGGQTPMAGFGVLRYDGSGEFSEENVSNAQGETVALRQFVPGTDAGRYTIADNGTGTLAGGGVLLLITRVSLSAGQARAEEYRFMVRAPVPINGAHFTGVVRRISD